MGAIRKTRSRWFVLMAVAVAAAAWGSSASALTSPRVFNLLDVSVADRQLGFSFDRPPRGGDRFGFVDALYKWEGTKQGALVGRVEGMGTFITDFGPDFSHDATVQFVAQAYLPGGSIVVQGYGRVNNDGPSRFTFPVVGGTGIYANARGYVNVRDLGNGNIGKSNVEFHLLP